MIKLSPRILIVEDSYTDAALLQRQLEKIFEEPEIVMANSIDNLSFTTKTFVPEIIFTDFDLGNFTAEDVLISIRNLFKDIPIIVVTGTIGNEEIATNIILKRANGFFLKKDMKNLHVRMEPLLLDILEKNKFALAKIAKEKERLEKLNRIHSILKGAAQPNKPKGVEEYYEKLLKEIEENIETIIR
ncbi:response regulator [Polaribacter sp. WD7]|uniref:response regulator n=1 Tax=Polaribacter sp. WD7 TaxID=2269061 RepID=UPI000DF4885A|nr:response regulator [Polaribacter sp. WD7]RCS27762.1 response regulator [Polaribacter sp. WD7]